ncbi:hypothetical protein [Peribacillus frigoritolerans]|nr:hypothetical protein [Peribacillus frigoritolerans]
MKKVIGKKQENMGNKASVIKKGWKKFVSKRTWLERLSHLL